MSTIDHLQEILALDHKTPAYDIWQLGCCCYCLATGQELFVPQAGKYYDINDKHLGEMTGVLGRLPRKVRQANGHIRQPWTLLLAFGLQHCPYAVQI
jgi:hypothetical protein